MTPTSTTTPTLKAQSRTITGKHVKHLRKEGQIPAVVYGHKQASLALSLDQLTFQKLFHEAGSTTLINLTVDDQKPFKVLVHDVQVDPIRHIITHVDLYQVNLKEKLTTEVPLKFVGVADAVEIEGGIFLTVKSEVEIECLPDDLVQEIEVDITTLKTFDDSITVKDLVVPPGIAVLTDPDQVIASVSEPISEEELAALDEAPETGTPETEFETKDGTEEAEPEAEQEERGGDKE